MTRDLKFSRRLRFKSRSSGLWRLVGGTKYGPLKLWYPTTPHGVTSQKNWTWIFTTLKTSDVASVLHYQNLMQDC